MRPAQVQGNDSVAVSVPPKAAPTAESPQEVEVREAIKRSVSFDLGQTFLGRHECAAIDEAALLWANQHARGSIHNERIEAALDTLKNKLPW